MLSYHSYIRDRLRHVLAEATSTLTLMEIFERVEAELLRHRPMEPFDLELTEGQSDPRWKVRVRSMISAMAAEGREVVRVSRGVYAPLHLAPEDLEDAEYLAPETPDQAPTQWLYAFSLSMAPGLLKVGRTRDLVTRMQQHRLQHAKAHLPDTPKLEAAWRVVDADAAEQAVHGLLRLRGQHYRGEGAGREWFASTVAEVQAMLDLAMDRAVPIVDVSDFNDF